MGNVSSQSATVTTIEFLNAMGASALTGVDGIDAQNTLWQLGWAQTVEPLPGTTPRTQDGSRM